MRSEARSEVAIYGRFTTFERPPMFQFNLCEYMHIKTTHFCIQIPSLL